MAVGYAYAILGDLGLAEDAAQEAFLRAYLDLRRLRNAAAFPAWFRRIVLMRCNRMTRRKKLTTVPLESASYVASTDVSPDETLASKDLRDDVSEALRTLPQAESMALVLHYLRGYSYREVAEFLDVPISTVKSRLHSARRRLREPPLRVVQDTVWDRRPSRDGRFSGKVRDSIRRATLADTEGNVFTLIERPSRQA